MGDYMCVRLTWTIVISKAELLVDMISIKIISSDGKNWT